MWINDLMTEPRSTFFGLRTRHLVMALGAILIAVAFELSSLVRTRDVT
jgi:hypothetical protein